MLNLFFYLWWQIHEALIKSVKTGRFVLFHLLLEIEKQIKIFLQSMPPKPQYLWLMCSILFKGGHLEKTMIQFMCTTTSQFAFISAFFFFFFFCPGRAAWSAVCPLMKWVLHKPIETRAMAATTKIIYFESSQWSDTSISSPAGDRENRGGHYKDHISEKERVIFYPTLTLPIPQTRPFSPAGLPSSAPLKMEACFPLNKLLYSIVCLWGVLYHDSSSTCSAPHVCALCVCESEDVNTQVGAFPPA